MMNIKNLITLLVLALSGLLTACSSTNQTQVNQYLLPYPATVSSSETPAIKNEVYRLKSITVPDYLQKQNIILVDNNGQVYQAANHLWAESIENQLEQMTLTYLASRLPDIQWIAPSQYQISAPYLTVNLEKFYASQVGVVSVSGYWTLWSQDNNLLIQKRFNYSEKMPKDGYLSMTEILSNIWFKSVIEELISTTFPVQPE